MDLRDLGARAHISDADANNLGFATLPRPVEPGDVFALETGPPLPVAAVVRFNPRGAVDCLVEANGRR
jgi:hypothetical protein